MKSSDRRPVGVGEPPERKTKPVAERKVGPTSPASITEALCDRCQALLASMSASEAGRSTMLPTFLNMIDQKDLCQECRDAIRDALVDRRVTEDDA